MGTGKRWAPHPRNILVDTNLLVLFAVGSCEPQMIPRHKRTNQFTVDDYHLLEEYLRQFRSVMTTPNVLTEVSNLVDQIDEKAGRLLQERLGKVIGVLDEHYAPSSELTQVEEFPRLGLADSSILRFAGRDRMVLTDDIRLYLALQRRGFPSINFHHLRERAWES